MQIVKKCTKTRLLGVIALIVFALNHVSCSEKQGSSVISREFQGEIWGRFDYLEADYNVVKAPMTADVVMDIEVTDVYPNIYPYHEKDGGLFVIVLCIDGPDGSRRAREYKFRLKDEEGNFKSEKVDGYYHFELPLINEMSFNEKGDYHFMIENKYTKDPLYGIKSLNINCLQINNKKHK